MGEEAALRREGDLPDVPRRKKTKGLEWNEHGPRVSKHLSEENGSLESNMGMAEGFKEDKNAKPRIKVNSKAENVIRRQPRRAGARKKCKGQ